MINTKITETHQWLPGIIGKDPAIRQLAVQIRKLAVSDRPVYLHGATGTGKELFAKAIHQLSGRKGELVAVNCSAIPENLFESLLFGHEKGAFTGADKRHHGFLAQAAGGTLFLDEVAELPILHQPKLLRVLETNRFSRVGSSESLPFTGRVITATHADMAQMVKERRFREDLFYRLNLFELNIPTLNQRREDIPLLVEHFAKQNNEVLFSPCALELFKYADWPGNIRQLKNTIDKLSVLADSDYLSADCIRSMAVCEADDNLLSKMARDILAMPVNNKLKTVYDTLVTEAVSLCDGNKTQAAKLLGVHRKVVERRLCQIGQ